MVTMSNLKIPKMTFSKRKKAPPGAAKESDKTVVVSVRLKNEQYQTALENCRKSGRKLSDYWRCALTKSEIILLLSAKL